MLARRTLNAISYPLSKSAHGITRGFYGSRFTPKARGMATSSDDLVGFGQRHVTAGIGRLTEAVMSKGEGSYLSFEDGRRMLDFSCGIGVTNLGHCHPKVSKAAADQCTSLVHGQCSIAFHLPYLRLIEKLLPVMPDRSLDSFYFWNSGSEAVEASLKMARSITGRQNIICMQGGYHGRTYGAMAVTKSKTVYSEGFFPLMPGVFSTPFPFWHQSGLPPNTSEEELVRLSLYQLELVLKQQSAPKDTAAILIEPVLGEGGYVPAPPTFLQGIRKICDEHDILLIIDEVQSGFGRTGKLFNVEYSGVRPDIMTMAKGLANGFPLSAVVSRKDLTDRLKPGSMGGTYAGNPVSCAAAVAVAEAFEEEKVLDNVSARSHELLTSLHSLRNDPVVGPNIVDVRGAGLMVAVEFASPSYPLGDPALNPSAPKGFAARVARRCMDKGLLILTTSIYEVIRFIPPLNISQSDLEKGCDIFAAAVKDVIREG
ncbi:acetylornithine aminotransferase [Boletus reticuloceps]|uniref:Acetylornithine aminotransferase n=1 Tax=Boletus reticuloceps TaxID=495285 RepID=A0A8I2YM70_9AGAM|nr:acetylornithine aminotransferase [Boletus reticuloceps]